jgi:hypothetical protein
MGQAGLCPGIAQAIPAECACPVSSLRRDTEPGSSPAERENAFDEFAGTMLGLIFGKHNDLASSRIRRTFCVAGLRPDASGCMSSKDPSQAGAMDDMTMPLRHVAGSVR